MVTWNYNCLLRIIISYLKPYDCENRWLLLNQQLLEPSLHFLLSFNLSIYLSIYGVMGKLLFKLVNVVIILTFSSSLVLDRVLFVSNLAVPSTHKGITIWGVRQPDVRGDVVADWVFLLLAWHGTESCCLTWCCFPYRQLPIDSSFLHSKQTLKQTNYMCEINK